MVTKSSDRGFRKGGNKKEEKNFTASARLIEIKLRRTA